MSFLSVPAVVNRADDLLPTARQMIDEETVLIEAAPDIDVSCRPNCNACCEHAVAVTPAEMRSIAAAVSALPASTQETIARRAREVRARVAAEIPEGADDFPRRYYGLREPCPLLIDGACSVREVRPLVCREYLMASAPALCDDRTLEHVVKIQRRRKVSARFQEVSTRFDDAVPRFLPAALLDDVEPANEASKSGPKLARILINGCSA